MVMGQELVFLNPMGLHWIKMEMYMLQIAKTVKFEKLLQVEMLQHLLAQIATPYKTALLQLQVL